MINDPHSILLGLYRESMSIETIESTSSFIKKRFYFSKKSYILVEEIYKSDHIWHLYDENDQDTPLSRSKILEIYTESNFNRHTRKK